MTHEYLQAIVRKAERVENNKSEGGCSIQTDQSTQPEDSDVTVSAAWQKTRHINTELMLNVLASLNTTI